MTTTVKEFKAGKAIEGNPVYVNEPYVIVSREHVVLDAGTLESIIDYKSSYYDNCFVEVRVYDLHLHDNTKINDKPEQEFNTFGFAKVLIMKFCQMNNLTIGMSDLNKAIDKIEVILNDLIKNFKS